MFDYTEKDFKIICVTNRRLCQEDFLLRLRKIAAARPAAILLREKDLPPAGYLELAAQAKQVCSFYGVPCVWHTHFNEETEFLHLPLPLWQTAKIKRFRALGSSCHSLAEAEEAARLGCTYLIAGHIFATDCKRGMPGRGLGWLRQICCASAVPVYAIGGINKENIALVKAAGASGVCLMSSFMTCAEPAALLAELKNAAGLV